MPTSTECASCHAPKGKTEYKEVAVKDVLKTQVDVKSCRQLLQIVTEGDGQIKEVMRLLSMTGVDTNYQDENGETAIMLAAGRGSSQIVDQLVKGGAEVNHRAWKTGYTALMRASKASSKVVVRALLQAGADPAIKNNLFQNAFDLAGAFDAERAPDIQRILYEELKAWVHRLMWEHTRFPAEVIDLILEYNMPSYTQAAEARASMLEHHEMLDMDHDRLLHTETEEERRKRAEETRNHDAMMQQREAGLRAEWQQRGGQADTQPARTRRV